MPDRDSRRHEFEFPYVDGPSAIERLGYIGTWDCLHRVDDPVRVLSRILQRSLLDAEGLMDADEAEAAARTFVGDGGICLTNIRFDYDGDADWTPMTLSTCDAGMIFITDGLLRCLWIED